VFFYFWKPKIIYIRKLSVKSDGIVFFFSKGAGGARGKTNAKLILIVFTKILKILDSPSSVNTD
jgi:hypothetical protein